MGLTESISFRFQRKMDWVGMESAAGGIHRLVSHGHLTQPHRARSEQAGRIKQNRFIRHQEQPLPSPSRPRKWSIMIRSSLEETRFLTRCMGVVIRDAPM